MFLLLGKQSHWYTGHQSSIMVLGYAHSLDDSAALFTRACRHTKSAVHTQTKNQVVFENGMVLWLLHIPEIPAQPKEDRGLLFQAAVPLT